MNKKIVGLILIFGFLGITVYNNTRSDVWSTVNPSPYMVYRIDDTYYVKNSINGVIDFSGTDCRLVVQNAIDILEGFGGGRIHFLSFIFEFYGEPLTVECSNIEIVGNGVSTILVKKTSETFFVVGNGVDQFDSVNFRNLKIEGSNICMKGIMYNKVKMVDLENVRFRLFNQANSIEVHITTTDETQSYFNFINCYFTGQHPLKLEGGEPWKCPINVLKIIGGKFNRGGSRGGTVGIELYNANTFNIVGTPEIAGFEIGMKLTQSSDKGIITGRFENNDVDVYIEGNCRDNVLMAKQGAFESIKLENYAIDTKIYIIEELS